MNSEMVMCPTCKVKALLVDDSFVYRGKSYGSKMYVCPNFPTCDTYVGVHKGTETPKGTMANRQLRAARMKAHEKFDPLWELDYELKKSQATFQAEKRKKDNLPARHKAVSKSSVRNKWYAWLAGELGIPVDQCHIGMMDEAMCARVIEACRLDKGVDAIVRAKETLTERVLRVNRELEEKGELNGAQSKADPDAGSAGNPVA